MASFWCSLQSESHEQRVVRSRFLPFVPEELLLISDLTLYFCLSNICSSICTWPLPGDWTSQLGPEPVSSVWIFLVSWTLYGPWLPSPDFAAPGTAWRTILWLILAPASQPLQTEPDCRVGPRWCQRPSQQVASRSLDHATWLAPTGCLWAAWEAAVSGCMPWSWFHVKGCIDIGKVIYKAKWRES